MLREALAVAAALALTVVVVARLAASDRGVLLYSDGDSLITVLVTRSLLAGEPQDWAMSSVLFLPEITVLLLLVLIGLPVMAALTINAVLNFLALYAAIRFAAGSAAPALAAFAGFALLALLDHTDSRESLELASLMATTTYYSATVIGVLVTLGLLLRAPGRPVAVVLTALVALASTASNPIYLAWAVVPFVLLLVAARHLPVRVRLLGMAALVGGSALGLLARVPLAPWITNTGAGYAQPLQWQESLRYYGELVTERPQDPAGAAAVLWWVMLILLGIALTAVAMQRRDLEAAAIAAVSWMAPVLVIVGAIALGTHAARYLQPAVFLSVLSLVALVRLRESVYDSWTVHRFVLPTVTAVLGVIAVAMLPPLAQVAAQRHPSSDVACVTAWVADSGRVGAGQFWTVRAPKAYADDPGQLVQVDFQLAAYAWLVNRQDFAPGSVSFLVTDELSFPFELPRDVANASTETVDCGRYTILDFGRPIVPLGAPHS